VGKGTSRDVMIRPEGNEVDKHEEKANNSPSNPTVA
tara:strand:- start:625 stop:732 length:108 start_codon:yes stop_codon:yes gene_type:complete